MIHLFFIIPLLFLLRLDIHDRVFESILMNNFAVAPLIVVDRYRLSVI